MKTKKCSHCGLYKPLSKFSKRSTGNLFSWCTECRVEFRRNLRHSNPDKWLNKHLKQKFGIDLSYYNNLIQLQEGKCAICKVSQNELPKRLYVDHDHKTGKVRGLICHKCNTILGHSGDNIIILSNAIKYLKKYES